MATGGESGFYTVTEHSSDPLDFESDAHPHAARTEDETLRIAHMLMRRRSESELLVTFDNRDGTTEPVGTLDALVHLPGSPDRPRPVTRFRSSAPIRNGVSSLEEM
jgi:hypothetical protein